jgi:hypothetical protein
MNTLRIPLNDLREINTPQSKYCYKGQLYPP